MIKTYCVLINEVQAEKPSDLPSPLKMPVFIGASAREVLFETSLRPPIDLPSDLPSLRQYEAELLCSRPRAIAHNLQ